MKLIDLERHLKNHGCSFKREGGSHTLWQNKNGKCTTIPRHNEIKNPTARNICKELEIPMPLKK